MYRNKYNLNHITDLHVHLGSAATSHLLWEIANSRGINVGEKQYWKFIDSIKINDKTGYDNYLKYFDLTENIQSSPDAVERSVNEAISLSYRKANIDLIEVRFNPMNRNKEGMYDLDRIIFGAIVGLKKAMMAYPVKAGLILSLDRRFSPRLNNIIIEKAVKFRHEGIIGLDLAGPIKPEFSFDDIRDGLQKAKKLGLGITIHTGEVTDTKEMWEVLEKIKPDRIGHGIRCIDDPELMKELSNRNIILEVCPSSNIATNALQDWDEVKSTLDILKANDVKFTINSDGPVLLQTNAMIECEKLIEKNILTVEEILNCQQIARENSFVAQDSEKLV